MASKSKDRIASGAGNDDVDEAFRALLEGIRSTLPAVEAIFAFLLIVPFQAAFSEADDAARLAYYVAFAGSGLASVLLIAPSAHQRLRANVTGVPRRSPEHLAHAVRLSIAGTTCLAVAMVAAAFLVSTLTFTNTIAVAAATLLAAAIAWAWFYVPLVLYRGRHQDD